LSQSNPAEAPAAYYRHDGQHYIPLPAAQGPWHPDHQNGACFSALLCQLLEEHGPAGMQLCRFSLTICGPAYMAPFDCEVTPIRIGRSVAVFEAVLRQKKANVRALATFARISASPEYGLPDTEFPLPAGHRRMTEAPMTAVVEPILRQGGSHEPGTGSAWATFHGQVLAGTDPSPTVLAANIADFGGALGSNVVKAEWTFANLDIDIHFVRTPRPGWHLITADTVSAGTGIAVASSTLADEAGTYAFARQTLFIAPAGGS